MQEKLRASGWVIIATGIKRQELAESFLVKGDRVQGDPFQCTAWVPGAGEQLEEGD